MILVVADNSNIFLIVYPFRQLDLKGQKGTVTKY